MCALNVAIEDENKFGINVAAEATQNCKLANVKIKLNLNNEINADENVINLRICCKSHRCCY